MKDALGLHLVQWRVVPGDVEANLGRAEDLLNQAGPEEGDLVLLPEMFPSGFFYSGLGEMASRSDDVLAWMKRICTRAGVAMAGSMPAFRGRGVANTLFLVDQAGGIVASYEKIHLFTVTGEERHFVPGDRTEVAGWGGLRVGLAICFDLRFPELSRRLCLDGAELVLVPAQWPRARMDHFRDLVRVRAMENQMFVAACNSCGDDGASLVLGGGSLVAGPSGAVLGSLGEEEGVLSLRILTAEVQRWRREFPVVRCRRSDIFGS